MSEKNTLRLFSAIGVVLYIVTICSMLYACLPLFYKDDIGLRAVNLMYNFSSLEELESNMEELKHITTEEVYRQLDINYDTRVINTYFKFKADPTKVVIENNTRNSVCYRVENPNVAEDRLFLVRYDAGGFPFRITKIEEFEIVRGIDDYGGVEYR